MSQKVQLAKPPHDMSGTSSQCLRDDEVKLNAKLRVQSLVQKHGLQTGMPRLRRAYAFETLV